MARAPNLEIKFYDGSLREVINSTIQKASVIVCLIGNGTALARLGGLGIANGF